MRNRYLIVGLAAVLALSFSVAALGGSSDPSARTASVEDIARKALRTAKKAGKRSRRARKKSRQAVETANNALGSAERALRIIGDAQATADQALASASINTTQKLGRQTSPASSPSSAVDVKTVTDFCEIGKDVIGGFGTTTRPNAVVLTRVEKGLASDGVRETVTVTARELPGLPPSTVWTLTAEAICVNN